jgi:putative endonuclease
MYVYILASTNGGALYVGVTNNLVRRALEHRTPTQGKHTTHYRVGKLVYWGVIAGPLAAIAREKQLKKWHRSWKIELIEQYNPGWVDLAAGELGLSVWR